MICKHFGFSESAHAYTIKESFKSKIRPDFIIKELNCNGDEERIEYCSYEVYAPKTILANEVNIAGVVCVSNCKLLCSIIRLFIKVNYFQFMTLNMMCTCKGVQSLMKATL